jgi:hypothetical protein
MNVRWRLSQMNISDVPLSFPERLYHGRRICYGQHGVRNMKTFLTILLGVGVLAALTVGCGTMLPATPYYYIYMANRTPHDLDDVGVYYGKKMAAEAGRTGKGGYATYGPLTIPVPDEAVVTWSKDIGFHRYPPEHSITVKLAGIVPPRPRDMNVWFLIEEDGSVTVKCAHEDDHAVNDPLGRSLLPYERQVNGE